MSHDFKTHNLGEYDAFSSEVNLYEHVNGYMGATICWSHKDLPLAVVIESLKKLEKRLQCIATDIQFQPDSNDAMFEIVAKRKETT